MSKKATFNTITKESVNIDSIHASQGDAKRNKQVPHYALQTKSSISLFRQEETVDEPVEVVHCRSPSSEKQRHFMAGTTSSSNRYSEKKKSLEEKEKTASERLRVIKKDLRSSEETRHFMVDTKSSSSRNAEKKSDRDQIEENQKSAIMTMEKVNQMRERRVEMKERPHFMTHTESTSARYAPEKPVSRPIRSKAIPSLKGELPHFMMATKSSSQHVQDKEEKKVKPVTKQAPKAPLSPSTTEKELPSYMTPTQSFLNKSNKDMKDEKDPDEQFIITPLTEEEKKEVDLFTKKQLKSLAPNISKIETLHQQKYQKLQKKN